MGKSASLFRALFHLATCLLLLSPFAVQADESHFPRPESLKPAVDFWVRVYTEVDTSSGFLHDARNLGVVYARLERDRDLINNRRKRIVEDLQVLASGRRDKLTTSQQQILALWPDDVSNEELARAAGRVRWQLGQADRFKAGLKRSGAYRDHIEAVIRAKGLPIELAVLPHVESSFHPGAYSSAAATGMWQFVRATAQRFMQVDHIVDERLDPYAATYGAMELLEYNYNALGTWPLALTAYNHGANGMARAVKEMGGTDIGRIVSDYRGPRFGFASRNFYAQFLAVLELEERAEEFFGPLEFDPHPEFTEYEMTAYVDAAVLADTLGISVNDLRRDNPALQPAVWSGTKRIPMGYKVKVDRAAFQGDLVAALGGIPGGQLHQEQIPDLSYTVRRGDSLSRIAGRYNTTVSELVAINQLRDRHRIRIGQELLLPQAEVQGGMLAGSGESGWPIPENGRYEVQAGDTLSIIATRFSVPEERLLALNSLNNRNLIYPGQTLSLTGAQAVADNEDLPTVLEEQQQGREEVAAPETRLAVTQTSVESPQSEAADQALPEDADTPAPEPQLARLSVDAGNTALDVDEAIQAAEEQEQLLVDLSSDPSDYSVADNRTIEIQAAETLGHYAEWLGIRAWDLRRLNGMSYGQPVISGRRLKLSFDEVNVAAFEQQRREYHRDLQARYFEQWRIKGTEKYQVKRRDLLVNLVRRRSVPMWLFRQYNPDVDSSRLQIGQEIVFPVVEKVEG